MITNIIKLDFIKLNEEIHEFENSTGKKADLFMNNETFNSMKKWCDEMPLYNNSSFDISKGRLGIYEGNDVYINDWLRYGEVNIESLSN